MVINGTTGNDTLTGTTGADTIYGLAGNDSISGDDGNDYLDGGEGNDSIYGGIGTDTLIGGDGNDQLSKYLRNGNGWFSGGTGDDTIWGGSGNDTIDGGLGNDSWLEGYTGNDSISGGDGNDKLYGDEGNDTLDGEAGNDYLTGGDGNDSVDGGSGNDSIYGGTGNDTYIGGDGNDYLYDVGGNNYFDAGIGNDTVYGDSGSDTVIAGDGNDTVYAFAGDDSINGWDGNDKLYGDEGNDTLDGGAGNDYLTGDDGNDSVDGGSGNDSIYGGTGNDTYIGGDGNDYLYDVGGNNYFSASIGNDTVYGDSGSDTVIAGDGNDMVYAYAEDDSINGGDGNDELYGDQGNDALDGGTGNDSIYGGTGNDTLTGGAGLNELYGGAGNDVYYISNDTTYIYDSAGTDTAYVSASFVKVPSSIENVTYLNGAQALPYWIDALLPDDAAGLVFLSLLGGTKTFNYTFPTSIPAYDTSADDATGWAAMTSTQQSRVKVALTYMSSVLDLSFTQTSVADASNTIAFANNTQTDSSGYAQYPDVSSFGSDLFLDNSTDSPSNVTIRDGTYGALTLIHEIGHTLGLEHPGNYNAGGGGTDAPYLTGTEDSTTWTVMSYTDYSAQYYLSFSPLDIAALQYLYGPSAAARTTDDTYQISTVTSNFIWDGAGKDTITAANVSQAATIYLTPGYWGYVGSKSSTITAAGQVTVNFGSTIEQLIGSGYSDSLYGNEANNTIDGGAGDDLIEGWFGNDSLVGGLGNDSLNGGVGNDNLDGAGGTDVAIFAGKLSDYKIQYDSSSGKYTLTDGIGTDGADTLSNIEIVQFSDKSVILASLGLTPPTISLTESKVSLSAGQTATITFTLSDSSTNFIASDITVSGGTLSNFSGNGISYTATFTPALNSTTNGVVSVTSGVFTDAAGNANADGSDTNNTVTLTVDTLIPTIAVSSSKSTLIAGETATLTITLSEVSTNFAAADVTVAGGTLSGFTGSGTAYTATLTPTANSTNSAVVSVASGVFTDAAGNANADGSDTNNTVTLTVDTRTPTYALSAASNSVDEGSTATFTLTTTNVASGTPVTYTLSGISAADVTGGALSGAAAVNSNGTATISIPIAADFTTEGAETLTVTALGKSASMTVNDTSKVAATVRTGTATADAIANSAVSENIDAGAGIDTLVYTSNSTAVVISKSGGGTVVSNTATGEVDTLINVERLKFSDTAIALDTNGVGGQAYRLYQAAFNRTPDLEGLGYWISRMDSGDSLKEVAKSFVNSAEFKLVYGASPTNAQIVTRFYDNVLHRAAESGGYNYWLGVLNSGQDTVAEVLASFSESPENQAGVISVIGNGILYTSFG